MPSDDDDFDYASYRDDDDEYGETFGCVFPGRCCMPGLHYPSECHTVEMVEAIDREKNTVSIISFVPTKDEG